jgi:hypothetical protein
MAEKLEASDLRPFRSALVARFEEGKALTADQVLNKLRRVLKVKTNDSARKALTSGESEDSNAAFVHYQDRRQVAWARKPVIDRVHYLAAVIVEGDWIAIHTTESSKREAILKALRRGKLGALSLADPAHLKAAFIKGRARTLWLRGTHRSTSAKPDTKVIGGRDLGSALDPIDDQTYRYTALRCEPANDAIGPVMGLAVDQSRLWVGPSADWDEFEATICAILEALAASTAAAQDPLPVLAAAAADLSNVEGAYDLAITPPEMLLMGPVLDLVDAETLAQMELLAFGTQFEVTEANGTAFKATVLRSGQPLGELDFAFQDASGGIDTAVFGTAEPGREQEFAEVLGIARDPEILTIYFDSGHTIQSRQAFSVRHRDIPFEDWAWVDFGGNWDVEREKPAAGINAIGGGERSLFSWVYDEWPHGAGLAGARGWLACDDRPGETADFLHIDESGEVPILTLIHAKGAKSASPARALAVVPYETVSSQAIKNLRHLDTTLSSGTLLSGNIPANLQLSAWNEGQLATRAQFVARLDALGTNFRRRVVILQPHVRRDLVNEVRSSGGAHAQLPRLRQLDTLLNGVAANCGSVGARLIVIGAQ